MSVFAFALALVVFGVQQRSSRALVANAIRSLRVDGDIHMDSNGTDQMISTVAADVRDMNSSDSHFDNNLECEDYLKSFNETVCHKGIFSQLRVHQDKGFATRCKSAWDIYVAKFCRDDRQRAADEQHKETVNHHVHNDYTVGPGHRGIGAVVVESSNGYAAAVILGILMLFVLLLMAALATFYIRREWRMATAKGMNLSGVWPYRWFYSSRKRWRVLFHRKHPISSLASDSLNNVFIPFCEPYAGVDRLMESALRIVVCGAALLAFLRRARSSILRMYSEDGLLGGKVVFRIKDAEIMEYRYNHSFPDVKKRGDQEKLVFEHLESSNVNSPHIVRRAPPYDAEYKLDLRVYVELWELGSVASFARSKGDKPGQTVPLETGLRLIHHLLMAMSEFHGGGPGKKRAHMDVKADNVFLRKHGGEMVLGLADFDHAILESQFNAPEISEFDLGQCRYRAPELLRLGKHVVRNSVISFLALQRADIYSTALVMWEIMQMIAFEDILGRRTVMKWGLAYEDRFEHLMQKDQLYSLIAPAVVEQGCRPEIPSVWTEHEVVAKVVELMKRMWNANWEDRPDAHSALACFELNEPGIHR